MDPQAAPEVAERRTVKLGPYRISARLKGKIARRVDQQSSNLNDVCVGILAAHYGVAFEPSGRSTPRQLSSFEQILLDVPAELRQAVLRDAALRGESQRNVVVEILSNALGIPFEPTGRWTNRRRRSSVAS